MINTDTATAEDDELVQLAPWVDKVDDPHDGLAQMVGVIQAW